MPLNIYRIDASMAISTSFHNANPSYFLCSVSSTNIKHYIDAWILEKYRFNEDIDSIIMVLPRIIYSSNIEEGHVNFSFFFCEEIINKEYL